MTFKSRYVSHKPGKDGLIRYSDEEHAVWEKLYTRQTKIVPGRACDEYLEGLKTLGFTKDAIPQIPDVNKCLGSVSGWQVKPVDALISSRQFFELLADRQFPVATFIRVMEELDYVTEPDIFHELFGHCPMIVYPEFAQFMQDYAKQVLATPESDWDLLGRLFWFTVEFGLIDTPDGLRTYGGGILSSMSETPYCVESDIPLRAVFDPVAALRTPYRIDILQPVYFVIKSYQALYDLITPDIQTWLKRARELGEFPPHFPIDKDHPGMLVNVC